MPLTPTDKRVTRKVRCNKQLALPDSKSGTVVLFTCNRYKHGPHEPHKEQGYTRATAAAMVMPYTFEWDEPTVHNAIRLEVK